MRNYLIKNIFIVNEGKTVISDLLIKNGRIEKMALGIQPSFDVVEIELEDGAKKQIPTMLLEGDGEDLARSIIACGKGG